MKRYTLGFIFDSSLEEVLLMHKNRPEWQKGKVNGVGGKVEEGEEGLDCIVRETLEEAGLAIDKTNWIHFATMQSTDWTIAVYTTIWKQTKDQARTAEDQKIEWFHRTSLPPNIITNLHWLVPAAREKMRKDPFDQMVITYYGDSSNGGGSIPKDLRE